MQLSGITCLEEKCTEKALMTVCGKISAVQGNPRMRELGEDMKSELEGRCCVCSYMNVYMCTWLTAYLHDPNLSVNCAYTM